MRARTNHPVNTSISTASDLSQRKSNTPNGVRSDMGAKWAGGDRDEFFQGELATLLEYLRAVGGYDSRGVSIKR
jgi:hypothetical protein